MDLDINPICVGIHLDKVVFENDVLFANPHIDCDRKVDVMSGIPNVLNGSNNKQDYLSRFLILNVDVVNRGKNV